MSQHHLGDLLATLLRIAELVPDPLPAWRADDLRQLAVERLWITAGNLADVHRLTVGIETGVRPWAELHRFPRSDSGRRAWL